MSRIAPTVAREAVQIDGRRKMTPARKKRIHEANGGRCVDCGAEVPVSGPNVIYDHDLILDIQGSDADEDIKPRCFSCNAKKTSADLTRIAKTRRQSRLSLDVPRAEPKMKSGKRIWPKRKFDSRRQKIP